MEESPFSKKGVCYLCICIFMRINRNDEIYVRTGIEIPESLREQARNQGIPLSSTLIEALKAKIAEKAGR
jgi:post-segregation antitoxin (ccd killing protein)